LSNKLCTEFLSGLFVHRCDYADRQHGNFLNLRSLNRNLKATNVQLTIDTFAGQTVLMITGATEAQIYKLLEMAKPNSRLLFNLSASNLDEMK
jgi:hypothetical protein